uniref:Putative secreted peptide n=1 Tax=Anopheles braziliensis TaxID=58242 RepID=A0A2M3ZUX2_9DIPT
MLHIIMLLLFLSFRSIPTLYHYILLIIEWLRGKISGGRLNLMWPTYTTRDRNGDTMARDNNPSSHRSI